MLVERGEWLVIFYLRLETQSYRPLWRVPVLPTTFDSGVFKIFQIVK